MCDLRTYAKYVSRGHRILINNGSRIVTNDVSIGLYYAVLKMDSDTYKSFRSSLIKLAEADFKHESLTVEELQLIHKSSESIYGLVAILDKVTEFENQ